MQIIQKVMVKQIITENSKHTLRSNFEQEKKQLELECQQLLFEKRKLINKLSQSKEEVENKFKSEINDRKNKICMLDFKIEQLNILEIGSEIVEKEMEAMIQVEVGMEWDKLIKEKTIVIKDNIVVRIDE